MFHHLFFSGSAVTGSQLDCRQQVRLHFIPFLPYLHNSPRNPERTNIRTVLRAFCLFVRQSDYFLACKLFRAGMHPFVSGGSQRWALIFPKMSRQSCSCSETFELGCVLMKQSLALQPFCHHHLPALKRRVEGRNSPPEDS